MLEGLHAESQLLAEIGEWHDFDRAHRKFHMLLTGSAGVMHAEQWGGCGSRRPGTGGRLSTWRMRMGGMR